MTTTQEKAIVLCANDNLTQYLIGKYHVIAYPKSNHLYITINDNNRRRVRGVHVERMCREAIDAAKISP